MKFKTLVVPIGKLVYNTGQIKGVPQNPRFIKDEKYKSLKASMKEDPDLIYLKELYVYLVGGKYVVVAGNQRLKAGTELDFTEFPCKIIPAGTPAKKIRKIAIIDNTHSGEDDWSLLNDEWERDEIAEWGLVEKKGKKVEFEVQEQEVRWFINVEVKNEKEAEKWYKKLKAEGLEVKIIN